MSVVFLTTSSSTGSHFMRSDTIARRLRARGHNAASIIISSRKQLLTAAATLRFRTIVFVKWFNIPFARLLRSLGKRIIFDCVDNFELETHPPYVKGTDLVDLFITNNELHREFILSRLKLQPGRVIVIEHHHSNVQGRSNTWSGLKVAGYVGQRYYCNLSERFFELLADRGIEFYWGDANAVTNEQAVSETAKVDCFIAYFSPTAAPDSTDDQSQQTINFKPAQKILLPFALGIPTIFYPYYSYLAAIRVAGETESEFLIARTEDDVIRHVDWLRDRSNEPRVRRLIAKQLRVADEFSLDKILSKYERAVA